MVAWLAPGACTIYSGIMTVHFSRRLNKIKATLILLLVLCAIAVVVACAPTSFNLTAPVAANELAVGKESAASGVIAIPINRPEALNYKSVAEIFTLRSKALAQCPALLKGSYIPSGDVFGRMQSGKPWWGLAGEAVYGAGDKSILGFSEESRFILNPYLLVGVDSATVNIWDASKITENDINNPNFPFFWLPEKLEFDPARSFARATYDVSKYVQEINDTGKLRKPLYTPNFAIVAYNARDLGFEYVWMDAANSANVKSETPFESPLYLRQFIHCGGSCGYPGGCNNMSPFTPELDRFHYVALPARLSFKLWRSRPLSEAEPPDFTFEVDLR